MKKLLTLLFGASTLLTTSCADSKVKVLGNLKITFTISDGNEIVIPIEIDSELSLNEGRFKFNEIYYNYSYDADTNKFNSYFEYKDTKYPYDFEKNSIRINNVDYSLEKHSISELQEVIIDEFIKKGV